MPDRALIIPAAAPPVWGLDGTTRAVRTARRAGLAVSSVPAGVAGAETGAAAIALRADTVVDPVLISKLRATPDTALVLDGETHLRVLAIHAIAGKFSAAQEVLISKAVTPDALKKFGFAAQTPIELGGTYDAALRKMQVPYAFDLEVSSPIDVERQTFAAVYKGVTDFVTKFVWPPVALPVTRVCARYEISPNTVTFGSLILVLAALYWFWHGQIAAGIAAGWLAALADTVDGKLARVTLTSSRWGNVFDHGIDLIHPPFWWLAWWHGIGVTTGQWLDGAMYVCVGGYVAGKLLEQAFISLLGLKVHIWQKLDSTFRLITARRNPNLAILTGFSMIGAAGAGYTALAAWTIFCFAFHAVRLGQALAKKNNRVPVASWLDP